MKVYAGVGTYAFDVYSTSFLRRYDFMWSRRRILVSFPGSRSSEVYGVCFDLSVFVIVRFLAFTFASVPFLLEPSSTVGMWSGK